MALDPRSNLVFKCAQTNINKTSRAKDFFSQIGKIGDVTSNSRISQGLRVLAKISDSIRTGTGALPTTIGSSLEAGGNWVLDNIGIGSQVAEALRPFNPGVVNQAVGQAQSIYTKVKSGDFKASQIPGYLQDFQNLERLVRGIYTPKSAVEGISVRCEPSPYAMDLFLYAPKQKFLFVAEIIVNDVYRDELGLQGKIAAGLVNRFQLPQVEMEYEEINMYNFKTRVLRNTKYNPVTAVFYDDGTLNAVNVFFTNYIKSLSPLANVDEEAFKAGAEEKGMDFASKEEAIAPLGPGDRRYQTKYKSYTAGVGPLENNEKILIQQINLYHIFNYGQYMNEYKFFHPRFIDIRFDELAMDTSDVSNITTTFVYDGMYFNRGIALADETYESKIKSASNIGLYPLEYVKTEEAASTALPSGTAPVTESEEQTAETGGAIGV